MSSATNYVSARAAKVGIARGPATGIAAPFLDPELKANAPPKGEEREEPGDAFSPLNDHARLYARMERVRCYDDRKRLVFARKLRRAVETNIKGTKQTFERDCVPLIGAGRDAWRGAHPLSGALEEAYKEVIYKRLRRPWLRRLYIVASVGGTVPDTWATLSSSVFTVSVTAVTSIMMQLQNEAQRMENQAETLEDFRLWIVGFFQVMLFVAVAMTAVQLINYLSYFYKTPKQILHEARFAYIMARYRDLDPTMPRYELEYNSECDPDVAAMYFSNREELDANKDARRGFERIAQLFSLRVEDRIAFVRVQKEFFVLSPESE